MDRATYEIESRVEETHWWFVGRRKLFRRIISELDLPPHAAVLDIGTSTGTNLRMLNEMAFTNVHGLDFHDDAIRWCAEKGFSNVRKGDVCDIPFGDGVFDLILATDIIEHVDDDTRALQEIGRVLKPQGRVLLTVPAFKSLWGLQDDISHHKRRYKMGQILSKIHNVGLVARESFYFNYILFIPIWLARLLIRILNMKMKSENELNSPLINKILSSVFNLDIRMARVLNVPFGVSICAVLESKEDAL